MTTIAFRAGIMAADSRAYSGCRQPIGQKRKIHRLDDGTLIGISATVPGQAEALVKWFADGADPTKAPPGDVTHRLLAVRPSGEVFFAYESFLLAGPLMGDYFAVGSGAEYALGAMAFGASAEEAVQIACRMDVWSEGPITWLRLGEGPPGS